MTPYFCLDVIDDNNSQDNENKEGPMKLLVMEFSTKLSSQGADKFIDVTVSSDYYQRFAGKLANGLSSLHNTPVINPDLNVDQKSFFHGIVTMITAVFDGYLASSDDDADENIVDGATQLARSMGVEKLDEIITAYYTTTFWIDKIVTCTVMRTCFILWWKKMILMIALQNLLLLLY